MLALLQEFAAADTVLRNKPLQKKIKTFLDKQSNTVGDLINYNNWIRILPKALSAFYRNKRSLSVIIPMEM